MANILNSKVTKADFKDSYTSTHGELFNFWIEFENGDKGYYSSKSRDQQKFVIGSAADYEKEAKEGKNGQYFKIKPAKPQNFSGNGSYNGAGKKSSNASFALSYAKDLGIANINQGKTIHADDVTKVADHFLTWLNAHE